MDGDGSAPSFPKPSRNNTSSRKKMKGKELAYEEEDASYRTIPVLRVNGSRVPDELAKTARPRQTLLDFLRRTLGLTGSKLGCAEGGCGACTVMISNQNEHYHVNACLMPVLATDGLHVTTIEGLGSVKDGLHGVQQAMVDMHGSQCGFCTPGIVVSIYTLLLNDPTIAHVEEHLDGNLCRCTGYRPIWDAARSLCDDKETLRGPCGTPCGDCPERETCEKHGVISSTSTDKILNGGTFEPVKMMLHDDDVPPPRTPLKVTTLDCEFIKPTTFLQLLKLMQHGDAKIVVGNTEVGIETRFKHARFAKLICPSFSITELFGFETTSSHISIGGCCSLSMVQTITTASRTGKVLYDMLRWFASTQIRNVASLSGNLVTASPISDMNPVLMALDATLVLASYKNGIVRRTVAVKDFFLKYRTVDLLPTEVLERIHIPVLGELEYAMPFKQARRREDDISIVTSTMKIALVVQNGKYVISKVNLAFGGMAPLTVMAKETAAEMIGKEFTAATFNVATATLLGELNLPEMVPGGQAAYRMTLAASFLHKFYVSVLQQLRVDVADRDGGGLPEPPTMDGNSSATANFLCDPKPTFTGTQTFPAPTVASGLETKRLPPAAPVSNKKSEVVVGKPVAHASGPLHCTGEALYTDDIPAPAGTLEAVLVLAESCGGTFESIDTKTALEIPGVAAVYTYDDIVKLGGNNALGPIVHDEVIFLPVGERVRMVGQVLGIVVAKTLEAAEEGARAVKVTLGEPMEKILVTVDDAVEANSYYEFARHVIERGSRDEVSKLANTPDSSGQPSVGDVVKVSGTFRSGAQEHFYLETNSTLAVPSESDTNLTIYASTQSPTKTQNYCASATGTPASKVVVRVKRMGGGFGGKETRNVFASAAAAIAAKRSSRPVRLTLSRDVDMKITGTRHAFVSRYCASAELTNDGAKLRAFDVKLYSNAGCGFDLSGPVVDRALFHVDGCYDFPHFRAEGVPCKTVQPPHTAFRGFGGPQGMAVVEHVVDHLALACGVGKDEIRRQNMYADGGTTPFGMVLGEGFSGKWNVPTMWDALYDRLDIRRRREDADKFNSTSKFLKRGIAVVPTKFGIAFTAKYMNQGGALVHVYTDGTVLVSIGGTEMGQGLFTKVCQVAAQAFGIPLEDVYVNDSSTDKVANTIPTAASMSTDLYGMATLDACRQIARRLEPVRDKLGREASFAEVARTAHFDRIDLSAHGFYAVDDSRCGYNWLKEKPVDSPVEAPENSWKGHPFNYFTQGVVFTEVEVDVLTGNHTTVHSDLIVDVGSSINPTIDIGQIEGAFIQGMGWSTIEEVIYACNDHTWVRPRGAVFTTGPGTYKIPAFNDTPVTFNVSLMQDADNPFAVHSSKAIGEPPFFLGSSVFYAIKDAVTAARSENLGEVGYFEMRMPATSERIRMHCGDSIASRAIALVKEGETQPQDFQPQGSY